MPANAFMIQGTGSNVGKSLLVAGLCRHFTNQGLKVRPFKPQNMSNNAAVTSDGGEIGRAQALQAKACKIDPTTDMNPVLLKPTGEVGSQLVVNGQQRGTYKAKDFYNLKHELMPEVLSSFNRLKDQADLVIVEGAGSASEVNLRASDIANMGFATAARIPVYLIGDIERGGVIANLVGTYHLLPENERALIKGYIINKFRGDKGLFENATDLINQQTGWSPLGIVPWFEKAHYLPAEDSQDLGKISSRETQNALIKIAVPNLPRIANFDDLDPLMAEPNVTLSLIKRGTPIPQDTDLILLPGSKSTIADLQCLYDETWNIDIMAHVRKGGHVLGLCGGYQMLGHTIHDPENIESEKSKINGLGLLEVETKLETEKELATINATFLKDDSDVSAYEIHMGQTEGPDCKNPLFKIGDRFEGATSNNNQIMGTYLHGLFEQDQFRQSFLQGINPAHNSNVNYTQNVEQTLDELAEHIAENLDLSQFICK